MVTAQWATTGIYGFSGKKLTIMEPLKAPFPYFGGKRRVAQEIWQRFGPNRRVVYVEPFAGSLAVLLANPTPCKVEIVTDTNGFVANFWRALKHDAMGVISWADYPIIHQDLNARQLWLMDWATEHSNQINIDAEFYSTQAAGWWAWGAALWIGRGWCDGTLLKAPHPHASSRAGVYIFPIEQLQSWFLALSERLHDVMVFNTSWEKTLTPNVLRQYQSLHTNWEVRILLDPPYQSHRKKGLYSSDWESDSNIAAVQSYQWAVEYGELSNFRIAYCCHEGDFPVPDGWTAYYRNLHGYQRQNPIRDCIMFSPACTTNQIQLL